MAGEVQTSEINWLAYVLEMDPEYYDPPIVYEWSDGRDHECTDHTDSGIYS